VNAVIDAVRQFGVQDIRMALTPERVWRAIHGSQHGGGGDADRAAEGTVAYGGAQTDTTAGGAQ
jgi:carbon-monoxide dehydrogenase large subunit